MNFAVFLCLSFIATTYAFGLYPSYNRRPAGTLRPKLMSLKEFLFTKIPDIAEELELEPSLVEHIGDTVAEYKESQPYFDQGDCIIQEGEVGKELFYLLSGKVEIYKTDKITNQKEKITVINAPFTFGEDAYVNKHRSATVCAKSHVTVRVERFMALNKLVNMKFLKYLKGQADFHRKSKFSYP